MRYYNHEKKKYQRFTVWKFPKFTLRKNSVKSRHYSTKVHCVIVCMLFSRNIFHLRVNFLLFYTVCFDQIYHPSTKFFWFIFAKIHSDTKSPLSVDWRPKKLHSVKNRKLYSHLEKIPWKQLVPKFCEYFRESKFLHFPHCELHHIPIYVKKCWDKNNTEFL